MSRTNVLGVEFDNVTMQEAVERALELISARSCAYCATPNPEIVMLAKEDVALREALAGADMVLPDGAGIVKGAAILGRPMKQKVPGIDFACGVMAQLAERGGSVYLFGAKPDTEREVPRPGNKRHVGRLFFGRRAYNREDKRRRAGYAARLPGRA